MIVRLSGWTVKGDPMPLVDTAVYVNGYRTDHPNGLAETYAVMRQHQGWAWIDLSRPHRAEIQAVAEEFGLHDLAVEDAFHGHQRSKLDRYGSTLFTVLRPAQYLDDVEKIEFGELHVFTGPNFVITVEHDKVPDLGQVRQRLEAAPDLLARGPHSVLYALLDHVVNEYEPVMAGLENDIDEIEDEIFDAHPHVTRRIHELFREVTAFQRATHPLGLILDTVQHERKDDELDVELQARLRRVHGHVNRVVERGDALRVLLHNALSVHTTLVSQRQNEEMQRLSELSLAQSEEVKKISSWAAILFAPTLVGTVYGMNFRFMPELHWPLGYLFALSLMVALSFALYVWFKRRGWL